MTTKKKMRESARSDERSAASPTRVGLLILELSVGGAEKALFQLATTLDRSRFTPIVFSISDRDEDRRNSLIPELRSRGIEVFELGAKRGRDAPVALCRLRRLLRREQIDVLQCFMFHANILGRVAGRLAGIPAIFAGIRVAERDAPRRLALDRLTRRFADAWICAGEATARFTRDVGGIPSARVFSIPNGTSIPPRAASSGARRRKRMIAVGRLSRQKGFDWLLGTADAWLTPEIRRDWELLIVGDGEERSALERLASEKELGDFARFAGWRSDARELIAESELFLLPSRWEGMPNALLEAAARGRATLCSSAEGVSEILGEDAIEQICELENVDQWRDKLWRLVADDALRRSLGARNLERVRTLFTVEASTRRYEELWSRVLREKRNDGARRNSV